MQPRIRARGVSSGRVSVAGTKGWKDWGVVCTRRVPPFVETTVSRKWLPSNTVTYGNTQASRLRRDLCSVGRVVPGHPPGGCRGPVFLCRVVPLFVCRGHALRLQPCARDAAAKPAAVD